MRDWFHRGKLAGMLLAVAAALVLAAACDAAEEVSPLERRAYKLNRAIMCPVCPGESIDQSQNPLAAQMRAIVVEKLQEGWSEEQIKAFFAERYGPSVLMEPPHTGFNATAWVLPPVGVALALVALALVLRAMTRRRTPGTEGTTLDVQLSHEEMARYAQGIEAALNLGARERESPSPSSAKRRGGNGKEAS